MSYEVSLTFQHFQFSSNKTIVLERVQSEFSCLWQLYIGQNLKQTCISLTEFSFYHEKNHVFTGFSLSFQRALVYVLFCFGFFLKKFILTVNVHHFGLLLPVDKNLEKVKQTKHNIKKHYIWESLLLMMWCQKWPAF